MDTGDTSAAATPAAWHKNVCAAGCACPKAAGSTPSTPGSTPTPRVRLNGLNALTKPQLVLKIQALAKMQGIIGGFVKSSKSPTTKTRKKQYDSFADLLITMAHGDHEVAEGFCGAYYSFPSLLTPCSTSAACPPSPRHLHRACCL